MTPPGSSLSRLVEVMAKLLAPDGCPWDREQTLDTLRPFLIEESYEVLDALDRGDITGHREELGDLLMQVVFQAALRQAEGQFAIDDVVETIVEKLVRRHPHVFGAPGASDVTTASEVLTQWEQIKASEKQAAADGAPARTLAGVPGGLPALARAQKLGSKAGRVGFDWPGWAGSMEKVREEVGEIEACAAGADQAAKHHEVGDLLFAVVNLARKLEVDAETALTDACRRFTSRFEHIEDRLRAQGRSPAESNLEEMDGLWNEAKRRAP